MPRTPSRFGFRHCSIRSSVCRGQRFAEVSETSREQIARLGHSFVRDGTVVLTHGYSLCALHLLLMAAETKVRVLLAAAAAAAASPLAPAERMQDNS